MARARTGPPWPRNCACAGSDAGSKNRTEKSVQVAKRMRPALALNLAVTGAHPERPNALARLFVAQRVKERPDSRTAAPLLPQQEIVVFRRERNEAQTIKIRHRLD